MMPASVTYAREKKGAFEQETQITKTDRIMDFLERSNPEKAEELRNLKEQDSEAFEKEIEQIAAKMREKMGQKRKGQGQDRRKMDNDAVTRPSDKGDWQQPRKTKKPDDRNELQDRPMPHEPGIGRGRSERGRESYNEVMRKRNDQFMEWLTDNFPEKAQEFQAAAEANPERSFRDMMPTMMKYRGIFETEKKNPELAELMKKDLELNQERTEILEQLKNSENEEDTQELTKELKDVVAARFDLILEKRHMKFEELNERLEKLTEELEKQQEELEELSNERDEQIDERLEQLLEEKGKSVWD